MKYLIFKGKNHFKNAMARTQSEALARGCEVGSTDYWWEVIKKPDGLESAIIIKDTNADKINLNSLEKSNLKDISTKELKKWQN